MSTPVVAGASAMVRTRSESCSLVLSIYNHTRLSHVDVDEARALLRNETKPEIASIHMRVQR